MKLSKLNNKVQSIDTAARCAPIVRRESGRTLQRSRGRVMRRDDYLCQHCLADGRVTVGVEVDHIVPLHLGGGDYDSNKQLLCVECHRAKSEAEEKERS
jgi:5-methylcytosine-specific restriction endonuclease McrA